MVLSHSHKGFSTFVETSKKTNVFLILSIGGHANSIKNSKIRKTQIHKPAYFFLVSNVFYSFDFWKSRFVTLQWLTQQSNLVAALKIEPDSSGAPSDPTQPRSQMLISKTFRKTKFEKCFRSHKPRNTRGAIVCTDSFILIDTCLLRIFSLFLPKAYFTL